MVAEILDILAPKSRETAVDCTLGHGGHARKILERLAPDGHLLGLDVDPLELPRTESSLRAEGFGADVFTAYKSNYAGISAALAAHGYAGAITYLQFHSQLPTLKFSCTPGMTHGLLIIYLSVKLLMHRSG